MLPLDIYLEVRKNTARAYNFHFLNEQKLATSGTKGMYLFNCKRSFLSDTGCVTDFQVTEFCNELGITVCDVLMARLDDVLLPYFLGLLQI